MNVFGYLHRVGDALSQLLNIVVFFGPNPNESLSGRCWRQRDHWFYGRLHNFIDLLFRVLGSQSAHCYRAHDADVTRAAHTLRNANI